MNSSRLPGKVLKPMAGAPMLQRLLERAAASRHLSKLVLATTTTSLDDPVAELAARLEIPCFRGSEADILSRFMLVVEAESPDLVVRLTGDNPLVCGDLIDRLVDAYLAASPRPDYVNSVDNREYPLGLSCELITTEALRLCAASSEPDDRENVTWFVRQRPEQFRLVHIGSERPFSRTPLTVDTPEDYERVRSLFETLYERDPSFDIEAVRCEGLARWGAGAEAPHGH